MSESTDLIANRAAQIGGQLTRSVLPLFVASEGGRPERNATGILIEVDGNRFILTAGHALSRMDANEPLYVGVVPTEGIKEVSAPNRFFSETGLGPSAGMRRDLGLLPLSRQQLAIFEGCVFLSEADIAEHGEVGDNADDPFYIFFGYPASRTQAKLAPGTHRFQQKSFPLVAASASRSVYVSEALDPAVHLALDYDESQMRRGDQRVVPPALNGTSGGGVFAFHGEHAGKLVGLFIEKRRSCLVATRILQAFAFAREVVAVEGNSIFA